MDSKDYFDLFRKTGLIKYYLRYREEMANEISPDTKKLKTEVEVNKNEDAYT